MDKYTFTGNIGQDCASRQMDNGRTMYTFTVAIDKSYKDQQGQKVQRTKWISCVRYANQGQAWPVAPYLLKGTKVLIEAEPEARAWVDKDGNAQAGISANVLQLELLGSSQNQHQPAPQAQQPQYHQPRPQPQAQPANTTTTEDDLPF